MAVSSESTENPVQTRMTGFESAPIEIGPCALLDMLGRLVLSFGILAALAGSVALAQQNVDTLVTNGKILTVDADFRIVQALAIKDGRIVARGTSEQVSRYAGPNTRVIDVA